MDKRVIKTIRDMKIAFMELRQGTALDKVRVNHLCETALINKSTFYTYYDNIYDLSDEMEDDIADEIIQDIDSIDTLFSDPESFIDSMMRSIRLHDQNIKIVFSEDTGGLVNKMEERLQKHYSSEENTPEKDILISFLIGGATRVMLKSGCDETIVKRTLVELLTNNKVSKHLSADTQES